MASKWHSNLRPKVRVSCELSGLSSHYAPELNSAPWKFRALSSTPSPTRAFHLVSHLSGSILTATVPGNSCGSDTATCQLLLCFNVTLHSNGFFERQSPCWSIRSMETGATTPVNRWALRVAPEWCLMTFSPNELSLKSYLSICRKINKAYSITLLSLVWPKVLTVEKMHF